jgi:hypothetical protein
LKIEKLLNFQKMQLFITNPTISLEFNATLSGSF